MICLFFSEEMCCLCNTKIYCVFGAGAKSYTRARTAPTPHGLAGPVHLAQPCGVPPTPKTRRCVAIRGAPRPTTPRATPMRTPRRADPAAPPTKPRACNANAQRDPRGLR